MDKVNSKTLMVTIRVILLRVKKRKELYRGVTNNNTSTGVNLKKICFKVMVV